MLLRPPVAATEHQAPAREQIRRGTGRRPPDHARLPGRENAEQLARAPMRVLAPEPAEQLGELRGDAVRTVMRRATAIVQPAAPLLFIPRHPFVADPPTHTVPRAELRHREPVAQGILDEPHPLVHRGSLQPRHRPSSLNREWLSSLEGVLPMLPDRSVTYVPGLYLAAA